MTTAAQREEWARLAAAATPGPFKLIIHPNDDDHLSYDATVDGTEDGDVPLGIADFRCRHDAAHYIAAREAIPLLLADLERAEAQLKTAKEWEGQALAGLRAKLELEEHHRSVASAAENAKIHLKILDELADTRAALKREKELRAMAERIAEASKGLVEALEGIARHKCRGGMVGACGGADQCASAAEDAIDAWKEATK
jgi:hypothetical protein